MQTLSLLIKPASGHCNMRCGYCFYADVTDTRSVKDLGMMNDDVLEIVIKKALSEADKYCVIGFQGGEPTLAGLEFFKKLIEYEKKYNTKNIIVSYTLQTNGLLLNDDWASFFYNNKFLIGLSIDAGKQVHDAYRADSSGKMTHTRCMTAARLLKKHKVEFNILSVVTRQLARHPDSTYRFYKQNDFRYIQFIPCLDGFSEERGTSIYSLNAKSYASFLCRLFDLWYADFINNDYYSIRAFDNYINILAGRPAENCAMNGVCNVYALIEADGSVYPCDFYAIDDYLLGNIKLNGFKELLTGDKAESFIAPSRQYDLKCKKCEYHFICRGGCRRDREPEKNNTLSLNHYCEAYKIFFDHTIYRMKKIADNLVAYT